MIEKKKYLPPPLSSLLRFINNFYFAHSHFLFVTLCKTLSTADIIDGENNSLVNGARVVEFLAVLHRTEDRSPSRLCFVGSRVIFYYNRKDATALAVHDCHLSQSRLLSFACYA
jgi:uncharacterized membrane protein